MSATPESTDDEVGEEEDEEAVRRIVDRRRSSVSELSLQKVDWNLKVKVLKEPSPKTSKVAKWSKRLKGRRDKANSLKDKRLSIIPEAFASHNNNNGAPTGVRAAIPGSPSFLQSAKRRLSAASHLSVLSASSQSASAGKWSSSEAPDASNMLDERLKAKTKALEKNKKGSKDETEGKEKEKENDAEERGGGGDQATILRQGENAVRT